MSRFVVTLEHLDVSRCEVQIDADSETEAQSKVLEMARTRVLPWQLFDRRLRIPLVEGPNDAKTTIPEAPR